jgi:hypothetical protein
MPLNEQGQQLMKMVNDLEASRFYGSIEAKFENGHLLIRRLKR